MGGGELEGDSKATKSTLKSRITSNRTISKNTIAKYFKKKDSVLNSESELLTSNRGSQRKMDRLDRFNKKHSNRRYAADKQKSQAGLLIGMTVGKKLKSSLDGIKEVEVDENGNELSPSQRGHLQTTAVLSADKLKEEDEVNLEDEEPKEDQSDELSYHDSEDNEEVNEKQSAFDTIL